MLSPLSRRAALKSIAAASALAAAPHSLAAPIDPIERVGPSRLRLSIAAYSYRQFLDFKTKQMDMFDFVTLAAKLGVDAVEPTSYWFPPDVDDAWLNKLKLHAFKLGLDISGTAIANDFCLPPGEKRDRDIAHTKTWIDRAAVLGAPVIRIFGGTIPPQTSEDQAVERVVNTIDEVLPHAAARGVSLALENHGGITATPKQLLKLVHGVKAPLGNFGVNLDTGNFHGDDPYDDIAKLAPYAINVQVKTEISRNRDPKQPANLARVIDILRHANYSGYVVLEYEAPEDPMTAIPTHLKQLRALLAPQ